MLQVYDEERTAGAFVAFMRTGLEAELWRASTHLHALAALQPIFRCFSLDGLLPAMPGFPRTQKSKVKRSGHM